jgi:hypothetical protein
VLGRSDVKPQHIDKLGGEPLGQLLLEQRDDHVVAGNDYLINLLGSYNLIETFDRFLHMLQVHVLDMPLEPGL